LAAPNPECGGHVSLAKLIADPDAYHGKALRVVAYATIEFDACPSENETQMKSCLAAAWQANNAIRHCRVHSMYHADSSSIGA
jgi:hypothetical protein